MYVWKEIYCYFYIEKHKFQHIFDNMFTLEQFLAILSKTIIWKLFYNNFSKLFYITTDEFFFIGQHCSFSETHGNCLTVLHTYSVSFFIATCICVLISLFIIASDTTTCYCRVYTYIFSKYQKNTVQSWVQKKFT